MVLIFTLDQYEFEGYGILAMKYALEIKNVTKEFDGGKGKFTALDNLSFSIEEGKIHGLLGPNGAGKSTLISLITGMQRPTLGSLFVFGVDVIKDPQATKKLIGIVPQELVIEAAFTVYEVLYYFAGMNGVPAQNRKQKIEEVLTSLDLLDKMHERARSLSGGMKRRLMVAKALLHDPKLLILDEPTAGVDVSLRQKMWEVVRTLNARGTSVLFTTHYLEEAEQLCETVTVINKGNVIKDGKLKDLQQEFSQELISFELYKSDVPHVTGVYKEGNEFHMVYKDLADDMRVLIAHYGDNIKTIKSGAASLESIFLTLTK